MNKYLAILMGLMVFVVPAMASTTIVDDFESYTTGDFTVSDASAAQGGPWTGIANAALAIEQEAGPNNYLAIGGTSANGAYRDLGTNAVVQGSLATYYYRVSSKSATVDYSIGLSDAASVGTWGDLEAYVNLKGDGTNLWLGVRNGGATVDKLATGLSSNTWYDIWLVVDNSADTYNAYYGSGLGVNGIGAATQIATNFSFRNGVAANDLSTFGMYGWNSDNFSAQVDGIQFVQGPFLIQNQSPSDNAVTNTVTLRAEVVDGSSIFSSATLYLDSFSNPLTTTPTPTPSNTVVTADVPQTLSANSTHTAYIVVNGTSPAVTVTNSWDFTMADQFDISVSPKDAGYALAYDYQPTVSAQIVNLNDSVSSAELYLNGSLVGGGTPVGSTTTVSTVTGQLAPGSNVTAKVIVYSANPGTYPNVTNEWSFTMGGDTGITVWNTNAPPTGTYDIAQMNSPAQDSDNISTDDAWTYVANNRPAQGQFFTTPSGANGYLLTSVWMRHTPYAGGTSVGVGANLTLRITDPALTNSASFVKHSETLKVLNDGLVSGDGRWIQLKLATPAVLSSNKKYGFDLGSGGSYFDTCGLSSDVYSGGSAYASGANGVGDNTATLAPSGDRTFMVSLSEAGDPFNFDAFSPAGTGITNLVTLKADFTELSGTYDEANTKLFFDGAQIPFSSSGSGPSYTITGFAGQLDPLTTHTGMVVVASSSPVTTATNYTYFTMAAAFAFSSQEPAENAFLLTNETPISVKVVNVLDTMAGASMYLDGGPDLMPGTPQDGSTTTVSVATSGALEPGSHTVMVVAHGAGYGDVTNSWNFSVGGGVGITIWGSGNPVVGPNDIAQLAAPASDNENIDTDDAWTYVAGNRDAQGQFFTTGSGSTPGKGFVLTSVWVRHTPYNAGGSGFGIDSTSTIRITDPTATNTAGFVVHSETLTVLNDTLVSGDGKWLQYTLATPVLLDSNKQYGFDLGSQGWYDTCGVATDPYAGGMAYRSGANGVGNNSVITTNSGDRTFLVALTETNLPDVDVISTSPSGNIMDATPELKIVVKDHGVSVDTNNVTLLLDGNSVSPLVATKTGTTTTVSYATSSALSLGSHTAALVVGGGNDDTNSWSFFVVPMPSATAADLWNVNIAGDTNAWVNVADGTVIVAPSLGADLWNNLKGKNSSGRNGPSVTNTFTVSDANGANSLGFETRGTHSWSIENANYVMPNMFYGWSGANAPMNMDMEFSGLATNATYDLYLYSTWGWTERDVTYTLTAGTASVTNGVILETRANVLGDSGENYTGIVEGDNYIIFTQITPTSDGRIVVNGQCPDGVISGLQLVKRGSAAEIGPPISMSIPAGGPITISWPTSYGSAFNVLTNENLLNSNGWGNAGLIPYDDGNGSYAVTNEIGSESNLFYKLSQ